MNDSDILPIVQGDWVIREGGGPFAIARVRQAYRDGGKVYMDLVPYNDVGENIGRQSPAEGGPKSFEPYCLYTGNGWQRIERPRFPLKRVTVGLPTDTPGKIRIMMSYLHDGHGGAVLKAERVKPRKQSQDYMSKAKVVYVDKPSNGPDVEIAALRRSAQELRDQAQSFRAHSPDVANSLKNRATSLEAEANRLEQEI